jgi:hypothetical protein
MEKKTVQQPGPKIHSSKRKATQQSAPLATAASTPEKAKKPKAAESTASLPSPAKKVKQLKAKPDDSASAVVPPPPPPLAETAKLTSPVAVAGSKKDTTDATKSTVGGIATISDSISVNAVVNAVAQADREESSEEEETSDEDSSSKGSDSPEQESEQDDNKEEGEDCESDPDDDEDYKAEDVFVCAEDEEEEELDKKPPGKRKLPVEKGMAAKVVPVSKMAMARSSAVAMGCSQQKGTMIKQRRSAAVKARH